MTIRGELGYQELVRLLDEDPTAPFGWKGYLEVGVDPEADLSQGDAVMVSVVEDTRERAERVIDALVIELRRQIQIGGFDWGFPSRSVAVLEWLPTGYPDLLSGHVDIEIVAKEVVQ